MENTKVLHALDEFAKVKPKDIPSELNEYLRHVAVSGDPVYQWSLVKCFFRQKMINVISEFYESCPMMDVPISPNVDPFNYEVMKNRLLERYDTFSGAPYTIQRIAELLSTPRKNYNHVDKFMRAIEKNIWVVSTREPGRRESAYQETLVNGVLSNVIHQNNGKPALERLQRQSELFDDDDEDEEPTVEIPSLEPLLSSEEDEPAVPDSVNDSVLLDNPEADLKDNTTDTDSSSLPHTNSDESASEGESEKASESVSEQAEEVEIAVQLPDEEEETIEQIVEKEEAPSEVEQVALATPIEQSKQVESSCVAENEPEHEIKADDQVLVTEVIDTKFDETEQVEADSSESEPQPICEEPDDEPHDSGSDHSNSSIDLKRKFEVTDEDDAPDDTPSKRLETEELAPVTEHLKISAIPATEAAETQVGSSTDENQEEDKEEKTKVLVETEICEVQADSNAQEVEAVMESSEVEERLEMVVEEPEQAMEVDDAEVQESSPMVEEDSVEPMEQSDPSAN